MEHQSGSPWTNYESLTGNQPISFVTSASTGHPQSNCTLGEESVNIYRAVTSIPTTVIPTPSRQPKNKRSRLRSNVKPAVRSNFRTVVDGEGREVICLSDSEEEGGQGSTSAPDLIGRNIDQQEVIVLDNDNDVIVLDSDDETSPSNSRFGSSSNITAPPPPIIPCANDTQPEPETDITCTICSQIFTSHAAYTSHITGVPHLVTLAERRDGEGETEPTPVYYALNESNVGYRLLRNEGWNPSAGLGASNEGRTQPIPTRMKNDRLGIGVKPRGQKTVTHKQMLKNEIPKPATAKDLAKAAKRDTAERVAMMRYMNED
ncbi:G patch domain and ankyrin repeat-containing protein 1 [Rhizophlyctis rosea]|uniref:G patch domain and ankyrin repeat-containing protein 1 n=1 Tax=Rhizophlyctis rosea TaxID=64517 RepID=A0AAD5X410_9FUNG|nr:G patch domain and ankyrin repeat-containing protein 1 [Rhizophlyctis rosea]